jgi:hypothetical protein
MTDYSSLVKDLFTAPARGMMAQPEPVNANALAPQGSVGNWLLKAHNALDPVQAMGGYGNLAAMALPPGAPLKLPPKVMWHGSPTGDFRGGASGLHLGTYDAASQALNARIGVPAKGYWDGTREYGKTLLAGKKTLRELDPKGYNQTGYNARRDLPEEDYYPTEFPKLHGAGPLPAASKPSIQPLKIMSEMSNSPRAPMSDAKANATMAGTLKRGKAKRGYYYKNEGEDAGSVSAVVPPRQVAPYPTY